MQTVQFSGGLALGAGKNPCAHLAPSFLWTELKTCREGGFNSLQSSAVGNQLMVRKGEKKGRKKHLAQRFSQAPVSMGTSSPGGLMSDCNRYLHHGATSSELNYTVGLFFTYQSQTFLTTAGMCDFSFPLRSGGYVKADSVQDLFFFLPPLPSLREGGTLPLDHLPAELFWCQLLFIQTEQTPALFRLPLL